MLFQGATPNLTFFPPSVTASAVLSPRSTLALSPRNLSNSQKLSSDSDIIANAAPVLSTSNSGVKLYSLPLFNISQPPAAVSSPRSVTVAQVAPVPSSLPSSELKSESAAGSALPSVSSKPYIPGSSPQSGGSASFSPPAFPSHLPAAIASAPLASFPADASQGEQCNK